MLPPSTCRFGQRRSRSKHQGQSSASSSLIRVQNADEESPEAQGTQKPNGAALCAAPSGPPLQRARSVRPRLACTSETPHSAMGSIFFSITRL
eukprot:144266-Prymnesium_polylepis.1